MSETILKTDREPTPEPVTIVEFKTVGQTISGKYMGKGEFGHCFLANGNYFYLSANSTMKTVNVALETVEVNSVVIKIEYLGEHTTESRKLFEVSQID